MTTVGIQYIDLQEKIRHNKALEELTGREVSIKQGELEVKRGTLAETIRFNNISAAQQEYANQTARITAEANARNAETNAARLSLDTYMYNDTGRALSKAQAASYQSQSILNAARTLESQANTSLLSAQKLTESERTKTEKKKQMTEMTKAAESIARGRLYDVQTETESQKASGTLMRGLGAGISALTGILKIGA